MKPDKNSNAYTDGYNAVTFALFRHQVVWGDHNRGLAVVPDYKAYVNFLCGMKASLDVLLNDQQTGDATR